MADIHVLSDRDDWIIVRGNSEKPLSMHSSESQALATAKLLAKKEHADLTLYGPDGQIRFWCTFATEPPCEKRKSH